MEDRYDISVDIGEGKDCTSQVFLHGKEVKWDEPIDTLFIKPAMEEEMKKYTLLDLRTGMKVLLEKEA